jgi:hypothetical protein
MRVLQTNYFGIGIGFNYVKLQLSIHLFIWCLDINFKQL